MVQQCTEAQAGVVHDGLMSISSRHQSAWLLTNSYIAGGGRGGLIPTLPLKMTIQKIPYMLLDSDMILAK